MVEVEVTNVVGTIVYRQELDLGRLAETFSQHTEITKVKYEPAEMHWLQTNFSPDNIYVAFYRNGKCTIAGCDSVDHLWSVVERVNSVMVDLLQYDYEPEAEINNIVATSDFDTSLPLELIAVELGIDTVEYEPELFPGLIYRPPNRNCVVLLFASGRVVITGGSDTYNLKETAKIVKEELEALFDDN